MMEGGNQHLTEDQITWALVDENDLPEPVKKHLERCPFCQERKHKLETSLNNVGELAARFSPVPRRRFMSERERHGLGWAISPWYRGVLTAALAGFLLVLIFGGGRLWHPHSTSEITAVMEEMREDSKFMAEVDALVENPLPQIYMEILGEGVVELDMDFMDFLVPDVIGTEVQSTKA
ncbi:MAG: hypothetical protein DRG63_07650 [Deltaproteobacteria bacterium]|nr:MAG: hypothetical protein DRG63_07650 [Deltaproteobacteria bacterium]